MAVQLNLSEIPKWGYASNPHGALQNLDITRFIARLFHGSLIAGGVGTLGFAAFQVISWPVGLTVSSFFILAALGVKGYQNRHLDYEGPLELRRLHLKASQMSLDEIVSLHGWSDLFRLKILSPDQFKEKYKQQIEGKGLKEVVSYYEKTMRILSQYSSSSFDYQLPRPRDCVGLWRKEVAGKGCDEIFQTYCFEMLECHGLVEQKELNCLKTLKTAYANIKAQHAQSIASIEREFQEATQAKRDQYEMKCQRAHQTYSSNPAVIELQGFELKHTREKKSILEAQNRRMQEATLRYEAAIASTDQQEQQNRYRRELSEAQLRITQDVSQQIHRIDRERQERLVILNREEARLKDERDQLILSLKGQYEVSIQEHSENKERRLRPIRAALQSSLNDCNARYRAHL